MKRGSLGQTYWVICAFFENKRREREDKLKQDEWWRKERTSKERKEIRAGIRRPVRQTDKADLQ